MEKGGGSVGEGGTTFVWKKEVGPPLKRLPVSDDWQKLGEGNEVGFMHIAPRNLAKREDFASEEHPEI